MTNQKVVLLYRLQGLSSQTDHSGTLALESTMATDHAQWTQTRNTEKEEVIKT